MIGELGSAIYMYAKGWAYNLLGSTTNRYLQLGEIRVNQETSLPASQEWYKDFAFSSYNQLYSISPYNKLSYSTNLDIGKIVDNNIYFY